MARTCTRSPGRGAARLSLLLTSLLLLSTTTPTASGNGGDSDGVEARPSRAEEADALAESLRHFFFGRQTTPAAQATPTPSPTPDAQQGEGGEERATPPAPPTGKAVAPRSLKYPLPPWEPLGAAGPKTVEPLDEGDEEFVPMPDRWRFPWPRYDRYDPNHSTPYVEGGTFAPFNQHVAKADYPVFGNHTFLNLNLQSASTLNPRTVAAGGRRDQFFINQNFVMGAELFGGTSLGQKPWVDTKDATGVAVGSPAPLDARRNPGRTEDQRRWLRANEEQPLAPLYGYAFVSDRVEGLVTVDITTLTDGVPTNNHLRRAATFNPEGRLSGARHIQLVGNYAYLLTDRALHVVDVSGPARPRWVSETAAPLRDPRALAVQFRYCFVTDADGLKVLDVTDLERPRAVEGAAVRLNHARGLYLARTYAYVAGGPEGLAVIDIERPERPRLDQMFDDGGKLNDAHDVKVGMMNASAFAFVADGRNGLKVVELTNPNTVPGSHGYSPRPAPRVVAYHPTKGPATRVSEGYRRDRGVDESGNQIAVFGRRGARPFNFEELRRMYLRDGKLFTVTDEPGRPTAAPPGQTSWLSPLSRLFGTPFTYLGLFVLFPAALVRRKRRRG